MVSSLRVLVRQAGDYRQIALLREGRLLEYIQEEAAGASWVGRVVLGRVERVLPDVKAAFVAIGQKRNGFLPLQEMESFHACRGVSSLAAGQEVLVQVKKDPKGDKGAFLTRDIALAGQYGLWMPFNRHIGVSSRVTNPEHRDWAQALGHSIVGDAAGMVVREAAIRARTEDVAEEMEALATLWRDVEKKAKHAKPPATLYQEASTLEGLVRDYGSRFALQVEGAEESLMGLRSSPAYSQVVGESLSAVQLDAAWDGARIESQVREALGRLVSLPGGGTLVVDEGEALSAVDLNTAHFTGKAGVDIALSINLAACPDIARHIQLRGLSGIILIDFVDMRQESHRQQVVDALQAALAQDRTKTVIHGFTSLGLLEMTRKRTRPSLRDVLTSPCGACKGSGYSLRKGEG